MSGEIISLIALLLTIHLCLGYRSMRRTGCSGCRVTLGFSASRHPEPLTISNEGLTLTFNRAIDVPHPSYVQILRDGILSVTSFSLMRKGFITEYDISNIGEKKLQAKELSGNYLWPNELSRYIDHRGNPVLLVPDGFLTPGQNDGGLFTITNPEMPFSKPRRITAFKAKWFYHKALYLELPVEPEEKSDHASGESERPKRVVRGVLTARANKPVLGRGMGELVWLSMPENDEDDGTPWEETVLAEGPDVMFEVADLNPNDGLIDIISAHFFGDKISIASMKAVETYPHVEIEHTITIDTKGKPYGLCLANLRSGDRDAKDTHLLVSTHECAYDMPGALNTMIVGSLKGRYPTLISGETVGAEAYRNPYEMGGSLYAYEIPSATSKSSSNELDINEKTVGRGDVYDVKAWRRSTLFQGFKVKSWGNVNPGAPGFPYVFYMNEKGKGNNSDNRDKKPFILLAGDGTHSAYIFSPCLEEEGSEEPQYKLAFEVECGATVGSAAVSVVPDGTGDVEIVLPSYELNKVHMYRLTKTHPRVFQKECRGTTEEDKEELHEKEKKVRTEKRRTKSSQNDRKNVLLFSASEDNGPKGGPVQS